MHELRTYYKNILYEAGCDEAGRGCLAGPVFAAAVILNPKVPIYGLQDSKKMSKMEREKLRKEIEEKSLAWSIKSISAKEIDSINILQASLKAMRLCVLELNPPPQFIIVDGNKKIPLLDLPQEYIIKGDSIYQSIAAASILAKTYRDEYMLELHREYPLYAWDKNKAYATALHREMIIKYGPTPHHRKTFLHKILQPKLL